MALLRLHHLFACRCARCSAHHVPLPAPPPQARAQKLSADQDDEEEEEEHGPGNRADPVPNVGVTFGSSSAKNVSMAELAPPQQQQQQRPGLGGHDAPGGQSVVQSAFSHVSSVFGSRSALLSRGSMSFFLGSTTGAPQERRITPRLAGHLVFISPFLAWAVLVCAINGVGYGLLGRVGGDIATAGIITFLIVRCADRLPRWGLGSTLFEVQHPPPLPWLSLPLLARDAGSSAQCTTCRRPRSGPRALLRCVLVPASATFVCTASASALTAACMTSMAQVAYYRHMLATSDMPYEWQAAMYGGASVPDDKGARALSRGRSRDPHVQRARPAKEDPNHAMVRPQAATPRTTSWPPRASRWATT